MNVALLKGTMTPLSATSPNDAAPKDYRWRRHLARLFGVTLTGDIPERLIDLGLGVPLNRQRRKRLDSIRAAGVLFVHIPKNAGTSVSEALYGHKIKHDTLRYYERVAPDLVATLPSFAIVRDPVERFVSAYRYAKAGGGGDRVVATPFRARYMGFRSIDDALDHVEGRANIFAIDHVFRPQKRFIVDRAGDVAVSTLIPIDRLNDIAALTGQPRLAAIRHANRSRDSEVDLTPGQIDRISTLYRDDVDIWNGLRG